MNSLIIRGISGLVFVMLVVGCIYYSPFTAVLMLSAFMLLCLWEFLRLGSGDDIPNTVFPVMAAALVLQWSIYLWLFVEDMTHLIPIAAAALLLLFFIPLLQVLGKAMKKPFKAFAWAVLAIVYVAIPFSLMPLMLIHYDDIWYPWLLLDFFIIIWASDTGAYLVGSWIGKHKLFPRISPKKTWEGSIGGLILALLVTVALYQVPRPVRLDFELMPFLGFAVLIVVAAALGDLIESSLKRSFGVKDAGKIMPGHGGMLDRFDAAIFAAPFAVLFYYFILAG